MSIHVFLPSFPSFLSNFLTLHVLQQYAPPTFLSSPLLFPLPSPSLFVSSPFLPLLFLIPFYLRLLLI